MDIKDNKKNFLVAVAILIGSSCFVIKSQFFPLYLAVFFFSAAIFVNLRYKYHQIGKFYFILFWWSAGIFIRPFYEAFLPDKLKFSSLGIVVFFVLIGMLVNEGKFRKELFLNRPRSHFSLVNISYLVFFITLIYLFCKSLIFKVGSAWILLIEGSMFALLNSFFEEIIFRGAFLYYLDTIIRGTGATFLQALFFSFMHYPKGAVPSGILGLILTGVFGFILGYITLKTRSLFPVWAIHCACDMMIYIIFVV